MFDSPGISALATAIRSRLLVPAIRQTDDVMHIYVLQDVLQKLQQPALVGHAEFATGYTYGERYYHVHVPLHPFTLEEVVTVLRDNLDHQDHDLLNLFYQHGLGCPTSDYAYRVGFVGGFLSAVLESCMAPVFATPSSTRQRSQQREEGSR